MYRNKFLLAVLALFFLVSPLMADVFTPIADIVTQPEKYTDSYVSIKGLYYGWQKAPGYPPVTRSDWVIGDRNDNTIYCTGKIPETFDPRSSYSIGQPITLLAKVRIKDDQPFLVVQEIKTINIKIEKMVSVSQIIINPLNMQGKYIGLLGVLAKGYGVKGDRMYLLADPTGAIKLGRLPKLYPTGTILHLRGIMQIDKNGLPILEDLEIVSARVDFD
jgi:hypothetical protein